jgi:type VI secretion system secreted protein VgrG
MSNAFPFKDKVSLELDGGNDDLEPRGFRAFERMNGLFEVEVLGRSSSADIDLESKIGRPAKLSIETPLDLVTPSQRSWTGICVDYAQTRVAPNGLSTYQLSIRPLLWKLSQRRNHRLFQHLSIPSIATNLLDEWQVPHELKLEQDEYPKLELRIQYGESDYDFLERLLEEAGIAYYFDDSDGSSKLVLNDAPGLREPREAKVSFVDEITSASATETEFATNMVLRHHVRTGAVTYRDYDYRRPSLDLRGASADKSETEVSYEEFVYHPGRFLHDEGNGGNTPSADDKGMARHEEGHGNKNASRRLEAYRGRKRIVTFDTNVIDLAPGVTFAFSDHPRADLGATLLAETFELVADENESWKVSGTAVFAEAAYRPLPDTPKPKVFGVQMATVVGPSGEEIHTDEYGRVRVQFPWDREGRLDDGSSCWMRVSQGWAGAGYGGQMIPRISQEVLVSFLDGDPDQPIVVGRVHNEAEPAPYKLPENKTVSTIKSDTSPRDGGFNELRFEDAAGRQLVYMQAEKDWSSLVKNDQMHVVGANRATLVRGEESSTTIGNHTRMVKASEQETVGQNRTSVVGRDRHTTVGSVDNTFVGTMFSVTVARMLGGPLAKGFGGAYDAMKPVLADPLTSTLGQVPVSPLGAPFSGSELGPMNKLAQLAAPQIGSVAGIAEKTLAADKGPPATGITMFDKHITLTTGGASIILNGPDIIISASGELRMQAKKDNRIFSEEADVVIQGGPMVKINPGIKPPAASCMKGAAKEGAAFIGGLA